MATSNFFHYRRPQVENQRTGYTNKAFLALASAMSHIAEPLSGTFGEDACTASGDHTFTDPEDGFIEVYCLPKSVTGEGESTGDAGAMHINWKPKFFIPGDTPGLQNMLEDGLLNDDLVLIVQDATCPGGGYRQFGCDCTPLNLTSMKFESGDTSQGRKGYAIETETSCRYFYPGVIKIKGEELPAPKMATPTGFAATVSDSQSVLTWNAVTSPVAATNYIVKKNGTVVYSGPLLTYTATGLTNGVSYTFTVIAQAADHADSNSVAVSVTPATAPITGYYYMQDDGVMPTAAFMIANGTAFTIAHNADYTILFPNTTDKYWVVFEPSAEVEKTHNNTTFGPDPFGVSGLFKTGTNVSTYRAYITNYATQSTTTAINFNQ